SRPDAKDACESIPLSSLKAREFKRVLCCGYRWRSEQSCQIRSNGRQPGPQNCRDEDRRDCLLIMYTLQLFASAVERALRQRDCVPRIIRQSRCEAVNRRVISSNQTIKT